MWWGAHEGMGWWMVFGGIWMVVFWGLLIGLVIWGLRSLANCRTPTGEDPLQIARRRFARGEITREELEEIEAVLGGKEESRA